MIISEKAMAQLRDLEHVPRSVGYNHEIAELDNARLIQWESGWGYIASDAGRAMLAFSSKSQNLGSRLAY